FRSPSGLRRDVLELRSRRSGPSRQTRANRSRSPDAPRRQKIWRLFQPSRSQSRDAVRSERRARKFHSLPLSRSPASLPSRDRRLAKQLRVSSPPGSSTRCGAVALRRLDRVSPDRAIRKTRPHRQRDSTARGEGGGDACFTRFAGTNEIIKNAVRNRLVEPALIAK